LGLTLYKYELRGPRKELLPLEADPFAFQQERPPATASVAHGLPQRPTPIGSWQSERERPLAAARHAHFEPAGP